MYQSKEPNPRLLAGLEPAPRFVFLYTICGILGSGLSISSITILSGILSSGVSTFNAQTSERFTTDRAFQRPLMCCVHDCIRLTFTLQGLKSKALPKAVPLLVVLQYLSSFLQLLSLFNHIGYIMDFFSRLMSLYPAKEAWYTAIIVTELVQWHHVRRELPG